MKRLAFAAVLAFIGGQALAADLPPPPPMPRAPATYIPVVPPYNWTGFYIGGNLGAGWTTSGGVSDTLGSTFTSNNNAQFLGGGQVGVNYEFWGGVVVGAEAMFDWLPNNSNTITATAPATAPGGAGTASLSINNRWITTATGKLGYAWDRVLFYGKGGGAWVGSSSPGITTAGGVPLTLSNTNSNLGWTAGLGVEWAFWNNWSARAEWDYIKLNSQTFTASGVVGTTPFAGDVFNNNNRQINMFTAGVNYKFGWGW
jgi:outer membrane immunogenic protein